MQITVLTARFSEQSSTYRLRAALDETRGD
jgi:hypothetical protein